VSAPPQTWDTEEAARLAREAYRFVAKHYPPDADLEPLDRPQDAVLEAQERRDWPAYVDALRELCRVARRGAIEAERTKVGAA
jgi:hypothetical protein